MVEQTPEKMNEICLIVDERNQMIHSNIINNHEDDKFIVEKIHIFEFISRLIRHIPDEQFKTIRYYGFYNKSKSLCDKLVTIIKKEKIPFMRSMLKWKNSILTSFNRIPIKCPKCGSLMKLCFDVT